MLLSVLIAAAPVPPCDTDLLSARTRNKFLNLGVVALKRPISMSAKRGVNLSLSPLDDDALSPT